MNTDKTKRKQMARAKKTTQLEQPKSPYEPTAKETLALEAFSLEKSVRPRKTQKARKYSTR